MKAVTSDTYGGPAVLRFEDVDRPSPNADQVLIDVAAASLNAGDSHLLRGTPVFIRLIYGGLLRPDDPILGMDVAGTVQAVGDDVTAFESGDEVIANVSESGHGGFAEYVTAPATALVSKPAGVTFEEGAAVPTAGVTSHQALRDDGALQAGEEVLVHGASGGVGTFAVQLATARGADVTGVCSTPKVETVREIGADNVVDYTETDVTAGDRRYDVIVDTAAAHPLRAYTGILRDGGRYVMVGGPASRFLRTLLFGRLLSMTGSKSLGTMEMAVDRTDLATVVDRLADGTVSPVVDRTFPLQETPTAIEYLESGRATGKVVISMDEAER